MKRKTPHPPAIGRGDAGSTVSGQQRADAPPGEPLRIYKPPKNDASEKSGGVTPILGQIVLRFRTNRFADYRIRSRASFIMLMRQLHHAHTPASSCSRASFILLACQLHHAHAPAISCSRASLIMLARQLHHAHTPASSCSRASFIMLAHQLHLARTPASSCSHTSFIMLIHQLHLAGA